MILDSATLLAYTVVLFLLIGLTFLGFWARERESTRYLWGSLPFFLGAGGAAFVLDPIDLPAPWGGRVAVWLVLLAYGFGWQVARILNGRRTQPAPAVAIPTAWLLFSATAVEVWQLWAISAAVRSAIIGLFNIMAALEFRRSQAEETPSRPILFGLFVLHAAFAMARIPFVTYLPEPLGVAPNQVWATVAYNLSAVTQALLASAFMIAFARERVTAANYRMARLDPLTGVPNRRAFDEQAQQRPAASLPVSLLAIDLDRFKSINDRYGHGCGDAVIRLAANTATAMLRGQGTVYRLGGEEFVCLLPRTPAERALAIADRLRLEFMEAGRVVGGRDVRATLSIGLATASDDPPDLWDILACADAALLEAKHTGRNQCVMGVDPLSGAAPPRATS